MSERIVYLIIGGILALSYMRIAPKAALGFGILSLGAASNVLVMFINNGKMPVFTGWVFDGELSSPTHYPMDGTTYLPLLGDWIPLGWFIIISIGDVLIYSGLLMVVMGLLNKRHT